MSAVAGLRRLLLAAVASVATGCAPAGAAYVSAPAPVSAEERLAMHLSGMIWPLPVMDPVEVTSEYGARGRRHHDGLDIDGRTGDPVFAARDGRVVFSGWRNGYGNTVVLEHGGGITTLYGHASALYVRAGERVVRGQQIAAVGATGNASGDHLHFEVAWSGVSIDPRALLPALGGRGR